MQQILFLIALIFVSKNLNAQDPLINKNEYEHISFSEKAYYKFGEDSLHQLITANLEYPVNLQSSTFKQTIMLQFTVDTFGILKAIKSIGKDKDSGFVIEAIRVLKLSSGDWVSAKQFDKKVEMVFRLPVKFASQLDDAATSNTSDSIYNIWEVTQPATFTGGEDSMYSAIYSNMTLPPEFSIMCGFWVVMVGFDVDKNGEVFNVSANTKLKSDINSFLSKAAIEGVQATNGTWSPAYLNGEKVNMRLTIPITFDH